jgi:hypothetical protein
METRQGNVLLALPSQLESIFLFKRVNKVTSNRVVANDSKITSQKECIGMVVYQFLNRTLC